MNDGVVMLLQERLGSLPVGPLGALCGGDQVRGFPDVVDTADLAAGGALRADIFSKRFNPASVGIIN